MKLIHFSDLHLDAHFAWLAGAPELARERRQSLRETLTKIVLIVQENDADALLCGGDLFEHERVTPDTGEFLRQTFAALDPLRVFIAPGNHDWLGPQSLYNQVEWSANVHVFRSNRLEPVELRDGIHLWGAAHCAPANTDGFLDSFQVDRPGVNLALFHGSERSWITSEEGGKAPHAPFDAEQIPLAGLDFAFLGHFHTPKDMPHFSYPGNPDPLAFGETGVRGAVIATVSENGTVTVERKVVAHSRVSDLVIDLTGCTNQQNVRDRLVGSLTGIDGYVRVTLEGEIGAEVDVAKGDLERLVGSKVQLNVGRVTVSYNLEAIREEPTIRGRFVQDVEADLSLSEDERRRILVTGLRALEGRPDLEVW
ncbi:MAG: metallophosphoesterase [Anaerolineaceae bacterium]